MTQANFESSTIWTGDNLPVLRGMNSECVDLIYLDPPFNSNVDYSAPIGSEAAGAEFKDTWTLDEIKEEWIYLLQGKHPELYRIIQASLTNSNKSYLVYMTVRLLEMKRILKDSGSIYIHCDPTMSHWLKILMDCIFGVSNFQNEIIWYYRRWSNVSNRLQRMHDVILFYSKSKEKKFNILYQDYSKPEFIENTVRGVVDGKLVRLKDEEGNFIRRKSENKGVPMHDVWTDINFLGPTAKERTGFPTQKPIALLNRIIELSSNEGDLIFDPFCGCATALISATSLNRRWIGIDISPKAVELIDIRMEKELSLFTKERNVQSRLPTRSDQGDLPAPSTHKKSLYGEQGGFCAGCDTHFKMRNLEIDHIVAKSVGGNDHISNLQLLCGSCNRIKGKRDMSFLRDKLKFVK